MTALVLDRMEIQDVGANSKRLAEAIHEQLGERSGPVPINEIALALDIREIREEYLDNFEAALITLPERGYGSILLNLNSSPQRRRYSIGHELLHFLNPWHEPTSQTGFQCSRQDMMESGQRLSDRDRHRRQESEANEFAIEMLAPAARVRRYVEREADLTHILSMATDLDISREAAARRYVALHDELLAVAFITNGQLRYAEPSPDFPRLSVVKGQPTPYLPKYPDTSVLSAIEEVDAADWLQRSDGTTLSAQVLRQRDGHAIVLLKAQPDEELEDTYKRFTRAGTERRR